MTEPQLNGRNSTLSLSAKVNTAVCLSCHNLPHWTAPIWGGTLSAHIFRLTLHYHLIWSFHTDLLIYSSDSASWTTSSPLFVLFIIQCLQPFAGILKAKFLTVCSECCWERMGPKTSTASWRWEPGDHRQCMLASGCCHWDKDWTTLPLLSHGSAGALGKGEPEGQDTDLLQFTGSWTEPPWTSC